MTRSEFEANLFMSAPAPVHVGRHFAKPVTRATRKTRGFWARLFGF